LYVGKAKSLKRRVSSYSQLSRLNLDKQKMVQTATKVKFEVLESEVEALLIEAELIRLHQPQYNVLLKDDKSPIYVQISNTPFPSVQLVRKRNLLKKGKPKNTVLGPFSSAYKLRQVLKIARRIFPWCDKTSERINKRGPNQKNKNTIQQELKQFHQPCFYHHLELCPGSCVGKISIQDYQQNIGQLILFLKGKKKQVLQELKKEMEKKADELKFEQANQLKNKIILIEDITSKKYHLKPDLILPALRDSIQHNALDHLKRILTEYGLVPRQHKLNRVEGYDVSNIMGKSAAVSMVVFENGIPDKKNYRLFNIYSIDTPNDYRMFQEAFKRRQKHPEWGKADLIIVDGGKGQIRAALSVWDKNTPIIGITKNPDRIIIPVETYRNPKSNRLKIEYKIVNLPYNHPSLHLVQQIRNESHRFAKKQHIKLRRQKLTG
jgi:excinuclease ABC subunit C